jgi:hypothetical protein
MAKKSKPAAQAPASNGESIAGYFRKIFAETPKLLKTRSNEKLLKRWLADHPDEKKVPDSVKSSLSNIKSVLRSKKRKRRKANAAAAAEIAAGPVAVAVKKPKTMVLETLEERIDDCLTDARNLDKDGLEEVIRLLRKARNGVVWKLGQ